MYIVASAELLRIEVVDEWKPFLRGDVDRVEASGCRMVEEVVLDQDVARRAGRPVLKDPEIDDRAALEAAVANSQAVAVEDVETLDVRLIGALEVVEIGAVDEDVSWR